MKRTLTALGLVLGLEPLREELARGGELRGGGQRPDGWPVLGSDAARHGPGSDGRGQDNGNRKPAVCQTVPPEPEEMGCHKGNPRPARRTLPGRRLVGAPVICDA